MTGASSSDGPSFQPFQCLVCQSRFTRHENLKRHAALHSRSHEESSLPCDLCQATFSRPDLRHRHMKRKHPEYKEGEKAKARRSTKRSRATPDGGRRPGGKTPSVSSVESQNTMPPHHSGDESEMEMGATAASWRPELWYEQRQRSEAREDRHGSEASNLTAGAPRSRGRDGGRAMSASSSLTQPPSTSQAGCMSHMVPDAVMLEQSLLLEASFLDPTLQFHPHMHPMAMSHSTPFDTNNLASFQFHPDSPDRLLSSDLPQLADDWYPSASQIVHGCDLFFNHVSYFAPFLHQPTFDPNRTTRHLVLSLLCLAYQYGDDPECGEQAGSGVSLSVRCFHRARAIIALEEEAADDTTHNGTMVQTYLLLQLCAMMYLCGTDSAYALKMHSKMISLARAGGLMQPVSIETAGTQDLDSLWREFIRAESQKRTVFAVHQIDALWYQFLSVPRSISHLEIKHELPCPEDHWTASSSAEWAHRQLIARNAGPSVQYVDAVRCFLSPGGDVGSVPAFDPYGAINVAQFLISSAREISGWSTMTGMLSMERIEPLRSSLIALGPFIHPPPGSAKMRHGALCEATWEAAMIELQMWSPSHTGGIVAGSMDAVLSQSRHLAPSCEFLCESNTAKAIQPHVDWFLRYLDTTHLPCSEAPWIALYAYKAFLIAWKLVCGGVAGAMQVVGVQDGDVEGALAWARGVFERRERWQLGKLILRSLDALEK